MTSWRLRLLKVVTGIAVVLLLGFQLLSSVSISFEGVRVGVGYRFIWSEYGMKATLVEIHPFTRLEGEVREEFMRKDRNIKRNKWDEAAS